MKRKIWQIHILTNVFYLLVQILETHHLQDSATFSIIEKNSLGPAGAGWLWSPACNQTKIVSFTNWQIGLEFFRKLSLLRYYSSGLNSIKEPLHVGVNRLNSSKKLFLSWDNFDASHTLQNSMSFTSLENTLWVSVVEKGTTDFLLIIYFLYLTFGHNLALKKGFIYQVVRTFTFQQWDPGSNLNMLNLSGW